MTIFSFVWAMCSGQHLRSTPSPRGRPSRIKRIDLEAWLNLLATEVGDWMPHETVVELPHYTKQEIFRTYLGDWEKFGDEPASQTTFYRTFTDQGKRVRLRLRRTFKKCSVCHDFDVRIKMTKDPEERQNLRDAKSEHLKVQRDERCVYSEGPEQTQLVLVDHYRRHGPEQDFSSSNRSRD